MTNENYLESNTFGKTPKLCETIRERRITLPSDVSAGFQCLMQFLSGPVNAFLAAQSSCRSLVVGRSFGPICCVSLFNKKQQNYSSLFLSNIDFHSIPFTISAEDSKDFSAFQTLELSLRSSDQLCQISLQNLSL